MCPATSRRSYNPSPGCEMRQACRSRGHGNASRQAEYQEGARSVPLPMPSCRCGGWRARPATKTRFRRPEIRSSGLRWSGGGLRSATAEWGPPPRISRCVTACSTRFSTRAARASRGVAVCASDIMILRLCRGRAGQCRLRRASERAAIDAITEPVSSKRSRRCLFLLSKPRHHMVVYPRGATNRRQVRI